jgi:hypothetical protein
VRFEVRQYVTNDAGLLHMPVDWRFSNSVAGTGSVG